MAFGKRERTMNFSRNILSFNLLLETLGLNSVGLGMEFLLWIIDIKRNGQRQEEKVHCIQNLLMEEDSLCLSEMY